MQPFFHSASHDTSPPSFPVAMVVKIQRLD